MSTLKKQAIAGVSAGSETEIRWRFPSVSATGPGRLIGLICDAVPTRIWGIKPSYVFALPLAPLGVVIYAFQKLFGEKYVLTNRSIQRWAAFGNQMIQSLPLESVADIQLSQQPGQEFFDAGDLSLLDAKGGVAMRIAGLPQAVIFRQSILEARDARVETARSLATIEARRK